MLLLIIFSLLVFGVGYYYVKNSENVLNEANRRLKELETTSSALKTENLHLKYEIKRLNEIDKNERAEREQNRRRYALNDISNAENQLRFIQSVDLYPSKPVNTEASKVLYALYDWLKDDRRRKWRISFEVGMGAFIKTRNVPDEQTGRAAFSSYNSKRVDFLVVDARGIPILVVEYHGSGHDLSDDAADRMRVKRLALNRAGIPLVEVPEHANQQSIQRMLTEAVATGASA